MELKRSAHLTFYLPDTRGVVVSRFGRGNLKIGPTVFTYSRLPGRPGRWALGHVDSAPVAQAKPSSPLLFAREDRGTCPGSTPECERICYARRPVQENGAVAAMWRENSLRSDVPEIPEDCRLLRIHVSGDFDTVEYVENWITRIQEHATKISPDVVHVWAYTRSWRVPELLPALERLRALPQVQLFASMDKGTPDLPPAGWRRAWIDGDERAGTVHRVLAHTDVALAFKSFELQQTGDDVKALICPEETKAVKDCESCGFCVSGLRNDVIFLEH